MPSLERVVVLKLNGGLGTSMGMTRAKSLLEVKDGQTFLDVIVRQVLHLRERHGAAIPLLLMNSFATRDDTLAALRRYPELEVDGLPLDFVQGKVPKLLADGFEPVEWPADPRSSGRRRATATSSPRSPPRALLASCSSAATSTCSCRTRTTSARCSTRASSAGSPPRGCRSCRRSSTAPRATARAATWRAAATDGGLVLRETAQVPDEDQEAFEDIERHRFFNANNIWVNLRALERTLEERDGVLGLPMIVNRKTVDPTDPSSPEVRPARDGDGGRDRRCSRARRRVHVPRPRFAPVKTSERPARGALGRLRAGGRLDGPARAEREAAPLVELDRRLTS